MFNLSSIKLFSIASVISKAIFKYFLSPVASKASFNPIMVNAFQDVITFLSISGLTLFSRITFKSIRDLDNIFSSLSLEILNFFVKYEFSFSLFNMYLSFSQYPNSLILKYSEKIS